jgi:hypothetical protein
MNDNSDNKQDIKDEKEIILHRDYCLLIDSNKYNRNIACKRHDNAYGINGGGNPEDRKKADLAFYHHMKKHGDPMAKIVYIAIRTFGWIFFNYKSGKLWQGQLIKRIFKSYLKGK